MEDSNEAITVSRTVKIVDSVRKKDILAEKETREHLRHLALDPSSAHEDTTAMELVKSFAAGSISASFSSVLLQPLDLVKTRLQLGRSVERSLVTHITHIAKTETVRGLWRGTAATIVRSVPGVGMYFATIHSLKIATGTTRPTPVEALILGVVSRSFAGTMLLPATVIKTRFESGIYPYKSMAHAARSIYATEGVRGLYSGLLPTLARDAPYSGLYLFFYTQLKDITYAHIVSPHSDLADVANFTCGVIAGLNASLVTHPADVLKTKMQSNPSRFPTVQHVVVYIAKHEGIQGYFSGLAPRLLRRTLMSAFAWTFYENFSQRLLKN